jgi:hypothetical protein
MSVRYAVIGDSIQWGQGLWEEDKFSSLVAKEIERKYGVSAECVARYAQSGASLGFKNDAAEAERTDKPPDFSGEVPIGCWSDKITHSQTIYSQLKTLKSLLDPKDEGRDDLDLLLLDGGINSGPFGILINPGGDVDDLLKVTRKACLVRMGGFLQDAARMFGKAHIIVTGYYPVFSPLSSLSHSGAFVAGMLLSLGYSVRKSAAALGLGIAGFINLVKLSSVWQGKSADALRLAVSGTGSSRVAYAHIDFGPGNCLFAYDNWLWGFGSLPPAPWSDSFGWDDVADWLLTLNSLTGWLRAFAPADPVRSERELGLCKIYDPWCNWASVGHPNKKGAIKYCEAIMQALEDSGFEPRPNTLPAVLHPLQQKLPTN